MRENSCDQEILNRQYVSVNETVAIIHKESSVMLDFPGQVERVDVYTVHKGKLR